jgi:hypothetical protein
MIRDVLDWQGNKIGELSLPDGTSEEVWAEKLAAYAKPPSDPVTFSINWLIKERKQFAEEMMERFKNRNIISGINAIKALWLHHRMRAWEVTLPAQFGGASMVVDILNMAVSGDLETAYFAIRYGTIDDMSQPHHCVDASVKEWLENELRNYLGFTLP